MSSSHDSLSLVPNADAPAELNSPPPVPPETYEVVRATWLSRKPSAESALVSAGSSLALAAGAAAYLADAGGARSVMDASGLTVFENHQYWRLWSTLFAHADLGHIAGNLFLFFILGFFLYGYFGSRLFPLGALVWGGVTNFLVLKTYDPETVLIGASGVVYWMGGAWLILYYLLSKQKNLTHRIVRTIGVAILIFFPAETFAPQVSYRTHLIGFCLGVLAGAWHYYRNRRAFSAAEVRETIIEEPELPPAIGDDEAPLSVPRRITVGDFS